MTNHYLFTGILALATAGVTLAQPRVSTTSLPDATAGLSYQQQLQASGGKAPYEWGVASGALPDGLSLNTNGIINGTPNTAGSSSFGVRVLDKNGALSAVKDLALAVGPAPLTITTASLPAGTVGTPYSQGLAASGGTGSYTWSITGALPAGLSLATNTISGTPTAPGNFSFTVRVSDGATTASKPLSITVNNPPLSITTATLAAGTVGAAYSQTLTATGGSGTYTWSITGALPAGLALSGNTISGTPTAPGTSSFTVRVNDGATIASKLLSITVNNPPLSVTTASLAAGTVGAAYSQTLAATGGSGTYSWSIASGSLPAGITLTSNTISGTPTSAGISNFTVQVNDGATTATKPLSITVNNPPLSVTTASLPAGTVNAAYSQTLAASGGSGTYTWSIQSGLLPAGITLSGNTISGTPTSAGTSSFTVQVNDGATTATKPLSITVNNPALSVTTASLPAATVNSAYSQTLAASGGSGTYTWSIQSGSLPAGISLSGNTISGTPSAAGTSSFTVQVNDGATTATKPLSITVNNPALSVTTTSLPAATVNSAYSQTLVASGGSGTYTWSIQSGALPAGITLSGSTISGTPSAAGTSGFTVQVNDGATTATKPLSITVNNPALSVTTTSLPAATVNSAYSQTLVASGGSGTYTWSIQSGALPAGITLSGNTISGTPTAAGTSGFTVQVNDGATTATKPLSITVNTPALSVTTASLPAGTVNSAYSQTLAASGGSGTYTWSIQSGSLPAGLTLSGNTISGTPTAAGTSGFTVQVNDGSSNATKPLSITVNEPVLTIATASLPAAIVSAPYSQTLSATGGSGPYTWSVSSGSLPAGLTLNGTTITGTPTTAGASAFTVKVSDASGAAATKPLNLTVNASTLSITTAAVLSNGTIGIAYSQTITATGGAGPYTWSLVSGSLPPGLSMNGAAISGNPSTAGTFGFTLQVSDSTGATTSKQFAITVAGPALVITSTSLPDATVGTAYSQSLTASGGTKIYTWSIAGGQLPPGVSLSPNGAIAGTPSSGGLYSFTVQVTDSSSAHTTAALAINVRVPLTIVTPAVLATGSAGHSYSQTLTAEGGTGVLNWTLTSGALPAGLTLHSDGVIGGTPTQVGTYSIGVQVADSTGAKAGKAFSLSIASGLTIATPPILPGATASAPYSMTLQPAGGQPPYVWSVVSGSLAAGLTFSADGKISGTPNAAGAFQFTVQLTDGNFNQSSKQFSLTVVSALVITTGPTLPNGASSAPYQGALTATGGNPPYVWSVTAGALPPGLTMDPSGTLTGSPSSTGTFTFTATVTDSSNITSQKQFTIAIGQGLIITSALSLPNATAGTPYTTTLAATGGQAPYSWTVTSGSLPTGLSLNSSTGAIAGTPTAGGVFNFTVQVTDAAKLAAAGVRTITVGLPSLSTLSLNGLPDNAAPLQQSSIDVALSTPYPVDVTGVLTLTFTPGGANPADDPAVQFSTGGRTVNFTIPANSTHAEFNGSQVAIQTGSVQGAITVSIQSLQAGGNAVAVPDGLSRTTQIGAAAPVIQSVTLVSTSGGFQVQIVGLSNTREMSQAVIGFVPAAGSTLQTGQLTVPLSTAAQAWFQSSDSKPFGGQFTLTLPFTVQGGTNVVGAVSVVLSNSAGASPAAAGS